MSKVEDFVVPGESAYVVCCVVVVVNFKFLIGHHAENGLFVAAVFLAEVGGFFRGGVGTWGSVIDPDEDPLEFALGSDGRAVRA